MKQRKAPARVPTKALWCSACRRRRMFVRLAPDQWGCPCGGSGRPKAGKRDWYVVEVTPEIIAHGKRLDPRRCPVAIAARRAGLVGACVTGETLLVRNRGHDLRITLHADIVEWILDFDAQRREVFPGFRFRVEFGQYSGIVLETALSTGKVASR